MTNLEIANIFLNSVHTFIHVESSGNERIPEAYGDKVIAQAFEEIKGGIDEERIGLEDVDSIHHYITHNLRAQIEEALSLNKDYETLSLVFTFTKK